MMKIFRVLLLIILLAVFLAGCSTINFDHGSGSGSPMFSKGVIGSQSPNPIVIPPSGFSFSHWSTSSTSCHADYIYDPILYPLNINDEITIYACYVINEYTISFESNGGTSVGDIIESFGSNVYAPTAPTKTGFVFAGWYSDINLVVLYTFTTMPANNVMLYAKWIVPDMVSVGNSGTTYTIPTGVDDTGTTLVDGGYHISKTETTYEMWYYVRVWAELNGYTFQNLGQEGYQGTPGARPTIAMNEPVTNINWRDMIVWCNALSEMTSYDPVYRTSGGNIIRDSRDSNAVMVDDAIQTNNNGYRLPTSYEWEMAARWNTKLRQESIYVGGNYWTPGNYASGAYADYNNSAATRSVAWYLPHIGPVIKPVGQLNPNDLGLYDMSGNVWEFCFDWYNHNGLNYIVGRGGGFNAYAIHTQVGLVSTGTAGQAGFPWGFRIVK